MLKNHVKLALRNIVRNKLYSVINVAGLGMASAFCILVYWYVQNENSFDRFHKNISQIYRVELTEWTAPATTRSEEKKGFFSFLKQESGQNNVFVTPPIMAIEMQKDFPEIEYAIRLAMTYEKILRVNGQSFIENSSVAYVDKDFFNVFSFPLLRGNPSAVLGGHNNIVVSERAAEKYFGKSDPVGKTILFPGDDSIAFSVSGVFKNFPSNSSLQFDLLIPRTSGYDYAGDIRDGKSLLKDQLFIQTRKGTNSKLFCEKLNRFAASFFGTSPDHPGSPETHSNYQIFLRPFDRAHYIDSNGWGHYTDFKSIYQLISITIVLLIIACFNYVLLTLTETVSRSQEVGIRKTIGAERRQIIFQFYTETQLLALSAVFIGFVLAIICLPLFSNLTGTPIKLSYISLKNILTLVALAIILGILSGIYPALVMSGVKPLSMMRKNSSYNLNPWLARCLLVIQSSVCIVLIISTLIINRQIHYVNQKDLGFDKEQIITVKNPYENDLGKSYLLKDRLAHFASLEASVQNFTSSFLGYFNTNTHLISNERVGVEVFDVDYNYFSFFKIPIVKGRDFITGSSSDSAVIPLADGQYMKDASAAKRSVIVNETLYNMLGRPSINEINSELGGRIIGVCKDYYPDELTRKISPAYHRIAKNYIGYFSFKIKPNQNIPHLLNKISATWDNLTENEPFSYTFLDERLAKNYDSYLRWMKAITFSSILSILIACMGLFGLSGLSAAGRLKEIGIRKVFGASTGRLFLLLNRGSLITVFISFFIAIPFAFYLATQWLQNFAYRIKLDWSLFVMSGLIALATALFAVSYHTLKAARANPVKSLRPE